jgi:hypothetical protein
VSTIGVGDTATGPNCRFAPFDDGATNFARPATASACLRVVQPPDLTGQFSRFDAGAPDPVTNAARDFDVDEHHRDKFV